MSEAAEAYQEVARRLSILPQSDVVNLHGRSQPVDIKERRAKTER